MSDTRSIVMGGRTFEVPPFPLRINKIAYPLCRELTDAGLLGRVIDNEGRLLLDCSADEMETLAKVAWLTASAADKELTREAFEELPISPSELVNAWMTARFQTGVWVPATSDDEGQDETPGEADGAA